LASLEPGAIFFGERVCRFELVVGDLIVNPKINDIPAFHLKDTGFVNPIVRTVSTLEDNTVGLKSVLVETQKTA